MEHIAFDAHQHYTLASVVRPDGLLVREQRPDGLDSSGRAARSA
jgi:hypothetical protein